MLAEYSWAWSLEPRVLLIKPCDTQVEKAGFAFAASSALNVIFGETGQDKTSSDWLLKTGERQDWRLKSKGHGAEGFALS